jgi:hypothetical protein
VNTKLVISVHKRVGNFFASSVDRFVGTFAIRVRLRFIERDKSYIVNCQCVYFVGIDRPLPLGLVGWRKCRASWRRWLRLDSIDHAIEPGFGPSACLSGRCRFELHGISA